MNHRSAFMVVAIALVALAGCDEVFDLTRPDGPPPSCTMVTTHDEDRDGVLDACDNCPGVENPLQEDVRETMAGALADGVGDACDPRPTVGGDHIEEFHAFADPGDIAAWELLGGVWSVYGDQLVFDEPNRYEQRTLRSRNVVVAPLATIETQLTVAEIDHFESYIGVTANADDPPSEISCTLHRPYEEPPRYLPTNADEVFLYHARAQPTTRALPQPMISGSGYRLALTVESMRIGCVVHTGDGQPISVADSLQQPFLQGSLGFFARHSKVTFDYVVVYGVNAAAR